jgi:hypothetical protein
MLEAYFIKAEHEQRIREAEKAYWLTPARRPSRLSVVFKSLVALLTRF